MPRRGKKNNNNTYRPGSLKVENEPEEGEIVDEYDLIVSSDEEISMRQRIRELEAENEEIEQIAVISRSYVDKINHLHNNLEISRAAQVPTDVSSISSTEFVTPKKRKRRKSKEHKKKHCQHQHINQFEQHSRYGQQQIPIKTRYGKSRCKRRQKLFDKKNHKPYFDRYAYKEINAEIQSPESYESPDSSSSATDTDKYKKKMVVLNRKSDTFAYGKYITRNTLRLAVARNFNDSRFATKTMCLKDKLIKQELVGQATIKVTDKRHETTKANGLNDNEDDDDDVQVIENEPNIQTVIEDSTDSMEEKELRLIALKSAVLKKHMARKVRNAESAYSPTDFEVMHTTGILHQDIKMDDLDVIDLEAEDSQNAGITISPEASPQLVMSDDHYESQQIVDCKPIDMDIVNSDSEDTTIGSWSKEFAPNLPPFPLVTHDFSNNGQYGYYMQDLQELPPPPPGVDDYENVPPPPSYHMFYNGEMLDMELDNEELGEVQNQTEKLIFDNLQNNHAKPEQASDFKESSFQNELEDEEEEEALRALLLSKFQSPKNKKKTGNQIITNNFVDESKIFDYTNKPKPTEFILKEAVKRLKIHSQTEHCKEDSLPPTKTIKCIENNSDSLILFEKLSNRYIIPPELTKEDQLNGTNKINLQQNVNSNDIGTHQINDFSGTNENTRNNQNTPEILSTVDISDISRRLQIIKETVLNSANKNIRYGLPTNLDCLPQPKVDSQNPCDSLIAVENNISLKVQPPEPLCQLNKPPNNLVKNASAKSEVHTILTKEKTVEANFNVITNKTTFKVTVANKETYKSDIKNTTTLNDVSHKENNDDNVSKNLPFKINTNSKSKVNLISNRLVKIINKPMDSNTGTEADEINSSFGIKSKVDSTTTLAPPTYSLLRTTKIVKPNKVINANFDLNRKHFSTKLPESEVVPNLSRPETINNLSNLSDSSRFITSIDQVKHLWKVAPFIISVQNSSNESSDEEWAGNNDSLYKPLRDYNDNASPLSLNLESPSRTPLRSNSPIHHAADVSSKTTHLETIILNKKQSYVHLKNGTDKPPQTNLAEQGDKIKKTPLAVRHLPATAQSEYRRLVHRMKLLENKRKSAKVEENKIDGPKKDIVTNLVSKDVSKERTEADASNSVLKPSLVKKVLVRNASNNTATATNNSKYNKSNVLQSYENVYVKFGAGIVNNLDKSLKLVEEVKKAKISKLKLENRLKELKREMDILQAKHKEEQRKISQIYPSICTTNEIITSLKQKRSKVFKAALNLGKTLKGDDYRLNNDLKETITTKSKKLATEIKIVNSLKGQDFANIDYASKPNLITKKLTESKKKTVEDCKAKVLRENKDLKINSNTQTHSTEIFTESYKEQEEETELNSHFNSEIGGNTELQKLELHHSKNEESSTKPCGSKLDDETNNTKKDSKQAVSLYISPLEHFRNIDSSMDPNGVICPYDLMGNCEDVTCKYVHITPKAKA